MYRLGKTGIVALLLIVVAFTARSVPADAIEEQDLRDRHLARSAAPGPGARLLDRDEGTGKAFCRPAPVDLEEAALLEELRNARKSGDSAHAARILAGLRPENETPIGSPAAHHPEIVFASPRSGNAPNPMYGDDVLVLDDVDWEGNPDMVSSASGTYYISVESKSDNGHFTYMSDDGGQTWQHFFSCSGGLYDMAGCSLAVPEHAEDYLYMVYQFGDTIQVAIVDIVNHTFNFYDVFENVSFDVGRPRIVTDNCDYSGYYVYVTFVSGTLLKAAGDGYEVLFARSTDKGVTWGSLQSLYIPDFGDPMSRPDIAYSEGNLYVVWEAEVLGPTTELDVYMRRSTDFGLNWDTKVNLTDTTSYDCFDPKVAAIRGSDEVVVVYTKDWVTDNDVYYGYSLDNGTTWDTNNGLASSTSNDEERPDIDVSPSLGEFHVVYWMDYDICHEQADHGSPSSFVGQETVNDTNQASRVYYPPTVAVDWTSGEAGVAWSDFRDPDYAIYFDRADWTLFQEPVPDVKGNGFDGPLTVSTTETVAVTVSMDPGDMAGDPVDWWVFVDVNSSITYWWRYPGSWMISATPVRAAAAPLMSVSSQQIYQGTFPAGSYVFTFAVDDQDNNFEGTYSDVLIITSL